MSNIPELRFGIAGSPATDPSNRPPLEKSTYDTALYGPGVPVGSMRAFSMAPAALLANNIAASQTPGAAGNLVLTAGAGVVSTTINVGGVNIAVLDISNGLAMDRGIQIVGVAGAVAQAVTVTGYDNYFQKTTMTFNSPTGAATVYGTKALRYIQSISIAGGTTSAITVGTADIFGFPLAVFNFDQMPGLFFNQTYISSNTGFTAADTTSPATAATGPVRGMYQLQSSASNGTRLFTAHIYESTINASNMNLAYGVIPA